MCRRVFTGFVLSIATLACNTRAHPLLHELLTPRDPFPEVTATPSHGPLATQVRAAVEDLRARASGHARPTESDEAVERVPTLWVGIDECDDYLRSQIACLPKMVPVARASAKMALETSAEAWKEFASSPRYRAGVRDACRTAREFSRTTLASFGCTP